MTIKEFFEKISIEPYDGPISISISDANDEERQRCYGLYPTTLICDVLIQSRDYYPAFTDIDDITRYITMSDFLNQYGNIIFRKCEIGGNDLGFDLTFYV